ncbi:MAG: hypothetical protein ACK419_05150 [Pyrinomonadaceae bacterium]
MSGRIQTLQEEKKEQEPDHEIKENPTRVTLAQVRHLSFNIDERYKPVKGMTFLRGISDVKTS